MIVMFDRIKSLFRLGGPVPLQESSDPVERALGAISKSSSNSDPGPNNFTYRVRPVPDGLKNAATFDIVDNGVIYKDVPVEIHNAGTDDEFAELPLHKSTHRTPEINSDNWRI